MAKAAEYTLNLVDGLTAFLDDGRIGIDRNPAETAKANGVDFYEYLKKLFLDLPNLNPHQNTAVLNQYLP